MCLSSSWGSVRLNVCLCLFERVFVFVSVSVFVLVCFTCVLLSSKVFALLVF